jgi:Smg protein
MFDILMYLFESYLYAGNRPDSGKLSLKLSAAGFENEEIHRALDWLAGLKHLNQDDYPAAIASSGTRCYSSLEARCISPEARSFLAFLEHSQIVAPVEREMILDRAVALGQDDLSVDKIKLITLMVLWNRDAELDPLITGELLTLSAPARLH